MPTYLVKGLDVDKVTELCQALPHKVSCFPFNAATVKCCYISVNRETYKINVVSFKRKARVYPNCTEITFKDFMGLLPSIKLSHSLLH